MMVLNLMKSHDHSRIMAINKIFTLILCIEFVSVNVSPMTEISANRMAKIVDVLHDFLGFLRGIGDSPLELILENPSLSRTYLTAEQARAFIRRHNDHVLKPMSLLFRYFFIGRTKTLEKLQSSFRCQKF